MRRTSGLLWPGFSKEVAAGRTLLWGRPVGRFDACAVGTDRLELRYRRWPVVDVLRPRADGTFDGTGHVRMPRGGRLRFCRFVLERPAD